jgi:hypothetical protein
VFTTVCIPQPALRQSFRVGGRLTVSAVVLGIALANQPFDALEMRAASPAGWRQGANNN